MANTGTPTAGQRKGPARRGPGGGQKGGGQKAANSPKAEATDAPGGARKSLHLAPPATEAVPKRRHYGILLSFLLFVIVPSLLGALYLFARAADQYASYAAFSVVKEEVSSPLELFGGVTDIGGASSNDADILNEFIQSQELVETLDASMDLRTIYSKADGDPVFALGEDSTIEDLHSHWNRMVQVIYDPATRIINIRALAFTPDDAHAIAQAVLAESAALVEELSAVAQEDTTSFAREEVDRAVERLKEAREALTRFRSETQIVDPSADLQGQMGLLSNLEQQLAEALIETDLLRESTREGDIRLQQAERRIEVIQARIADERRNLGVGGTGGGEGDDYATLLSEFERLTVDREFAEQAYTAALAAFDTALAEARRKSRYLFAHIRPTTATSSQFPQREMLAALLALFLLAGWGIAVLIYYSVRDRR